MAPEIDPARVRFLWFKFVDYVEPSGPKRFDLSLLFQMDGREFIARTYAMARIYRHLHLRPEDRSNYALLGFRKAAPADLDSAGLDHGDGHAYRVRLAPLAQGLKSLKICEEDIKFRYFDRHKDTELEFVVSSVAMAKLAPDGSWVACRDA